MSRTTKENALYKALHEIADCAHIEDAKRIARAELTEMAYVCINCKRSTMEPLFYTTKLTGTLVFCGISCKDKWVSKLDTVQSDRDWNKVHLDKENYLSMRRCLHGMTLEPDRLWRIVIPEQLPGAISEYNWEVTGVSSNLIAFLRYGANAYHFLFTLCPQLGWKVEEVHVES